MTSKPDQTTQKQSEKATESQSEFEKLSNQAQPGIITEFYDFLKDNKKWWLLPILILLGIFGLLIALSGSAAAPFIYTLF